MEFVVINVFFSTKDGKFYFVAEICIVCIKLIKFRNTIKLWPLNLLQRNLRKSNSTHFLKCQLLKTLDFEIVNLIFNIKVEEVNIGAKICI